MATFKVKAQETFYYVVEIDADTREILEDGIYEGFAELFDVEDAYDYERAWEVQEIDEN